MTIQDILNKANKNIFKDLQHQNSGWARSKKNFGIIRWDTPHAHGEITDYITLPNNKKLQKIYLDSVINLMINLRVSLD